MSHDIFVCLKEGCKTQIRQAKLIVFTFTKENEILDIVGGF